MIIVAHKNIKLRHNRGMDKKRFEEILMLEDFAHAIQDPEIWKELSGIDDTIRRMKNFDQRHPYHCYDLLMHTAWTVQNIPKHRVTEDEYRLLKIAAFFHDIGKPDTIHELLNEYGTVRYSYAGHPEKSEEICTPILERLGYDEEEIRKIRFYVTAHDMFMRFLPASAFPDDPDNRRIINEKNVVRAIDRFARRRDDLKLTRHDFAVLGNLCVADGSAHSKIVYGQNGTVHDTREQIMKRYRSIRTICEEAENDTASQHA